MKTASNIYDETEATPPNEMMSLLIKALCLIAFELDHIEKDLRLIAEG
jgi:hypothetical protein